MDNKRIIFAIKISDIDISDFEISEIDVESDSFKEAFHNNFIKKYGEFSGNISIDIHDDTLFVEWVPDEINEDLETEFEKAIRMLLNGNIKQAMEILDVLSIRSPNDPSILYNLGMCYSDIGNLDKAIDLLTRCVKLTPFYSNAYVALGVAYARKEMLEESEFNFINAIELDKNNSFAYRNLGAIFGKTGNYINSVKFTKLAYEIDPEDPNTLYGLGLAYQKLGDHDNATNYYEKLINIGGPEELISLAKDRLKAITEGDIQDEGIRTDAIFYCLSALQKFENMNADDIQKIAFEIGLLGTKGIDIDNPEQTYTLETMPGEFSGFQLISYMYVGFKIIDPTLDIGVDLSKEYNFANKLFQNGDF